ncbi:MAG TPA: hypothetical protein VES97_00270, partial [Solirubrobacteraceae bacterium]|nr:hypothetical protein [Solirubrobacteraceae bacterium]
MTWGQNNYGQLGDGTTEPFSDAPMAVSGLSGVSAIAAGLRHNLALLGNGTGMAWGDDIDGQLGDGNVGTHTGVPVAVSGLSGVVAIAAGAHHSLALLGNGTVMAWGSNE